MRYNRDEPMTYSVFRSRDHTSWHVNSHKEVVPMGYVNSEEEYVKYVKLEYPNAVRKEGADNRDMGPYYYTDGSYNIFFHKMRKLNGI